MSTVIFVFLLLSATAVVAAIVHAVRLHRGNERRQMFVRSFRTLCDGIDGAGISIVSTGASRADTVARMLATEYERCEAVVVVDSADDGELLARLVENYSLVPVDYMPAEEMLVHSPVRSLYRSRRRRFRRLTVADVVSVDAAADADTAAGIARYDYVVALHGDTMLLRGAVERLAAEVCSAVRRPREVVSTAGLPLHLYLRDDLVDGGGYSSGRRHFCRRADRLTLDEPLAVGGRQGLRSAIAGVAAATVWGVAGVVLSVRSASPWPALSVAASWLAIVAAAAFSSGYSAPWLSGRRALGHSLQNFCEKIC